jgi:Ran GTPase-activating protein (RanGAP) involved in mRNA processing and transport
VKLSDNFFSENVEAILLETLNKNTTLVDIALNGNRFSHSCLSKIKKITQRNIKMIEEQEPNKLKAEIYRLRYEHQKLEQAKNLLKTQKEEIEKVKSYREELVDQMHHHKLNEEKKREELSTKIKA